MSILISSVQIKSYDQLKESKLELARISRDLLMETVAASGLLADGHMTSALSPLLEKARKKESHDVSDPEQWLINTK